MGLAWQQGPLGLHPAGRFLVAQPLPEHFLYAEPARRRMRVELAGATVAQSDGVTLLHETGRYPVAYFPPADVDRALLRASARNTAHPLLGRVTWWSIKIGDESFADVVWSHPQPPEHAAVMTDLLAFSWSEMDASYEEDEPIFGHEPTRTIASTCERAAGASPSFSALRSLPTGAPRLRSSKAALHPAGTCHGGTSCPPCSRRTREGRFARTRESPSTSTSSPAANGRPRQHGRIQMRCPSRAGSRDTSPSTPRSSTSPSTGNRSFRPPTRRSRPRGATAASTSTLGISRSSHKPHRLPVTVGMRTRRSFLVDDEATAFEALRRHGFATLISVGDDGRLYASRLATILRRDRARRTRLWSHIDRRNQQAEPLRGDRGSPVGQQSRIAELMRCELPS